MNPNPKIWVLLWNQATSDKKGTGPPYWFRSQKEAARFASQANSLYPHMPELIATPFPIWPGHIFNRDKFTGTISIIKLDGRWYALSDFNHGPSLRLFRVPLRLVTL